VRAFGPDGDGRPAGGTTAHNVNALIWYTLAQLRKLGIAVPTSWDEFIAALDELKAKGVQPFAVGDVVVCNRRGALYAGPEHLDAERTELAGRTNSRGLRRTPDEVLAGADVLIGPSGPGAVTAAGLE
jgi:hypothetical protein